MFPQSHRRDLIETLLGNEGNLIALSKLADILRTDRKTIKNRLKWFIDQKAVTATKRHKVPRSFVKRGPDSWDIIFSINRQRLMRLLRKPIRRPYCGWDRMWRVCRAYKRFSRHDLCELAAVSEGNARSFTKKLRQAGYVREAKGCWELIRDPGPARPIPEAK